MTLENTLRKLFPFMVLDDDNPEEETIIETEEKQKPQKSSTGSRREPNKIPGTVHNKELRARLEAHGAPVFYNPYTNSYQSEPMTRGYHKAMQQAIEGGAA